MAEANNLNRIEVIRETSKAEIRETLLGQIFAFLIALGALTVSGILGYVGESMASSVIGGTTIVGLVTAFIQGRKESSDSRKQRGQKEKR